MELWLQVVLLTATGALSGFLNVLAGGGSLFTMPVMRFLEMSGPLVNGTNRVAIVAQNATAVWGFFRKGYAEFKLSVTLALCYEFLRQRETWEPGAIAGAIAGNKLEGVWFDRVLAAVMVAVLILMAQKHKPAAPDAPTSVVSRKRVIWGHALMMIAGFYGGFIQAGVGFILMAILHQVMGMDLVRVNMHKVFIVGVFSVVALLVYAVQGNVDWIMGLVLSVGNAAGAYFGSHVTIARGEKFIRVVMYVALVAMALALLLGL